MSTMREYKVELDVYHGPLDLLLYLIKRDEIDINNIPIHHITEQYLAFVKTLNHLDINLAGEFLVMAATLMEIKSAMILPREDAEALVSQQSAESLADPADPRYELVRQLLAYKRFKDAAYELDGRRETFEARFPRNPARLEPEGEPPAIDLSDVQVWDLLEAFGKLMEQVGRGPVTHKVEYDDTPIELHMEDIVDRLGRDGAMTLQAMFTGRGTTSEMIGLFLGTLELMRQRKVRVQQDDQTGDIHLRLLSDEERAEPGLLDTALSKADPKNAADFEWPDDESRRRYERRQERRARGEVIIEDEELEADLQAIEAEEQSAVDLVVNAVSPATPPDAGPQDIELPVAIARTSAEPDEGEADEEWVVQEEESRPE